MKNVFFCLISLALLTSVSQAQESDEGMVLVRIHEEPEQIPINNPSELVEVRMPQDVFLPYKQRQNKWGFLFSIGAEQTKYGSMLTQLGVDSGDDFSFEEMFGKNGATMTSIELGPKYNFSAGSLAILGGYGSLDKTGQFEVGSGTTTSGITVTRYTLSAVYYLDTLFPEPYFVPYMGGGIWQADFEETSDSYPDEVVHYTTEIGTQWRVGALFGLDWIETDSARVSRRKNGMQGTYLNIFAMSTMMSESNTDDHPNLATEFDLGGSLVIEF